MTSSSSSKMVSSLVMYRALRKDGTSSRCIFEVSLVEAVWLLLACDLADGRDVVLLFLGLTGEAVVCV